MDLEGRSNGGMGRQWPLAAHALLKDLVPNHEPLRTLQPDLASDESEWFVRGWEASIYPVGRCPMVGLKKVCGPDRLDHFLTTSGRHRHLLTRWTIGGWGTSREYVTHLAAYARAILDYGYPQRGSLLSHYGQYRRDLILRKRGGSYEIDAAFPLPDSEEPWLLIEAKKEASQISRWAEAIDHGATPQELVASGFKEIEYVLELRPRHLWLVGPGTIAPAAHVWQTNVRGLRIDFQRLLDVPVPSGYQDSD